MLATFKETLISLRDPQFVQVIVSRSIRNIIWFWTKYLLLFTAIPFLILFFASAYYTPQLPRLLRDRLPYIDLEVKDGSATSSARPQVFGNSDFSLIIDTATTSADLSLYKSAILVNRHQLIAKSQDGQVETRNLKDLGNFHFNKDSFSSWISSHTFITWVIIVSSLFLMAITVSGFYWLSHLILFAVWAGLLWLFALVSRRKLSYSSSLKLVIYASVLPLIVSALTFFSDSSVIFYLNLILFVFYLVTWFRALTASSK